MSLRDLLASQVPRDTAGALSSDRFEYQRNWALCRLLLLHVEGHDYVMTFDHHEDVTILDSETDPQNLQGFQVKTKDTGNWTVQALIKQPSGAGAPLPSIMGKLCDLTFKFPGHVTLLQVVSNAPLRAKLEVDNKSHLDRVNVQFLELTETVRTEIQNALNTELAPNICPSLESKFEYQVSDLSLTDHSTHAKGKLADALHAMFPDRSFSITAVHRALLSEITARNNNHEDLTTYEEFLEKKSLSRSRFTDILASCGVKPKEPTWTSAEAGLIAEQTPFSQVRALRNEWENVLLDRFRRRDAVYLSFIRLVRAVCDELAEEEQLLVILTKAADKIRASIREQWAYSDEYIKACILVHLYES